MSLDSTEYAAGVRDGRTANGRSRERIHHHHALAHLQIAQGQSCGSAREASGISEPPSKWLAGPRPIGPAQSRVSHHGVSLLAAVALGKDQFTARLVATRELNRLALLDC